jgi:type I restriction enzyme M protein
MAIILPHGVLFRGGAEERIRTKLLKTATSTPSSACPPICSTPPAFRSASSCSRSARSRTTCSSSTPPSTSRKANARTLTEEHIEKIVETYQFRKEEERYSKRIPMERIAEEGYNLNISRYISTICPIQVDQERTASATALVLEQAEVLCTEWAEES